MFRLEEFASSRAEGGGRTAAGTRAVLRQHVRAGRLLRVRRGLYAVVPRGAEARGRAPSIDPLLLASRLASDSVIAYHSALQLHGRAYSLSRRFTFLTETRVKRFEFRGSVFVPVPVRPALRAMPDRGGGIVEVRRGGVPVRVTTLERTLVDVLDAPRHGGGWEEIWRSLESVEYFDVDAVTDYALKLGSAVTVARVGFFLDQHREPLMVEEAHLARLREHAPAQPAYLERGRREPGKLVARWNLVVPQRVLRRDWAAVP